MKIKVYEQQIHRHHWIYLAFVFSIKKLLFVIIFIVLFESFFLMYLTIMVQKSFVTNHDCYF